MIMTVWQNRASLPAYMSYRIEFLLIKNTSNHFSLHNCSFFLQQLLSKAPLFFFRDYSVFHESPVKHNKWNRQQCFSVEDKKKEEQSSNDVWVRSNSVRPEYTSHSHRVLTLWGFPRQLLNCDILELCFHPAGSCVLRFAGKPVENVVPSRQNQRVEFQILL